MTIKKLVVEPVIIQWDDSSSCRDGIPTSVTRVNVGFLICQNESTVIIASEILSGAYAGFICILRSQLKKVTYLDEYRPTTYRTVEAVPPR